jgi:hypothetical protein
MPHTPRPSNIERTDDVDFIEGSRPLPTGLEVRKAREADCSESTANAVVGLAGLFGRRRS